MNWESLVRTTLDNLASSDLYRHERPIDFFSLKTKQNDKNLINFASNDYLGFSSNEEVIEFMVSQVKKFGSSSAASRLVSGTRSIHKELEAKLAKLKNQRSCVVFPTGYHANIGVVSSFGKFSSCIYSDELNHASIIDGIKLSRARVRIYKHLDLNQLEAMLREDSKDGSLPMIVTDVIFSMDGDLVEVDKLTNLAREFNALLVLDEAHCPLGPELEEDAFKAVNVIRVGTLSKIFGSQGGFACSSFENVELIRNSARSYIFTTGLSPQDCAAALGALDIFNSDEGNKIKSKLAGHIEEASKYVEIKTRFSPIIPVIIGDESDALNISKKLFNEGFFIPAIRPPTVPKGTARLRISLSSAHERDDIAMLFSYLKSLSLV